MCTVLVYAVPHAIDKSMKWIWNYFTKKYYFAIHCLYQRFKKINPAAGYGRCDMIYEAF